MYSSIGKQLGELLAYYERDLNIDPDDMEALEKVRIVSDAYSNFINGQMLNFADEFDSGYRVGCHDIKRTSELDRVDFDPSLG